LEVLSIVVEIENVRGQRGCIMPEELMGVDDVGSLLLVLLLLMLV
jgi:hypothetical protein